MRTSIIAFFFGILLLQQLQELPGVSVWVALVPAVFMLCRGGRLRPVGWFVIGLLWALFRADSYLSTVLEPPLEGEALVAVGYVEQLPLSTAFGVTFRLRLRSLHHDGVAVSHPKAIQLNWYGPERLLSSGAQCEFTVRMNRPHGRRNPGGGDYERWLLSQGIGATGYVIHHPRNRCDPSVLKGAIDRTRQRIGGRIRRLVADPGQYGPLVALAVADRSDIDERQWAVLRNTGTAHLLAISGLHIALIAGFGYGAARWAWSLLVPLARRWPAQRAAAVPAIVAALVYAGLAGFSLPTQRALTMVTVAMGYQLIGYRAVSADSYFVALAAVLLYDPFAVLSIGFWLSFGAVGILVFYVAGRGQKQSLLSRVAGVHLLLAVGLSPLLGGIFQAIPLVSPLANMIAVPWVTLVVVPLVLAGIVFAELAIPVDELIWRAAGHAWCLLWDYLSWLAAHAYVVILPVLPGLVATVLAGCGIALILLPRGLPGRWLAPLLLLALVLPNERPPDPGAYRLTVLDVGQGLAVVVQTAGHALLYDTGPSYAGGSDAGRSVVLPFLRARGISRLDTLVLSHADNDHAGGAAAVIEGIPVDRTMTNPSHALFDSASCRQGGAWQWDGVRFEVLHPGPSSTGSGNELSCVIKVTGAGGSALLAGDIERLTELSLVAQYGRRLRSDVIVVPHHGSETSSAPEFVRAVRPRYALFSVGYRNRFGFPAATVTRRYSDQGARVLATDASGAIDIRFANGVGAPSLFRPDNARYWDLAGVVPDP